MSQMQSTAGGRSASASPLRRLYHWRETIWSLTSGQLRSGHRDKLLGHLWNLLDPLLFMGVYFLVFGLGFRQVSRENPLEFVFYLSIGVLAWRFLESSVSQATLCVPANRGLIHEINFPKAVFPVSICLARLYDFAWGLVVLLAALLILRQPLGVHVLWLPLIIAVQLALTIGLAFVVAYLGAFFADTRNIIDVALRLGFYASPIFYYATGQRGFIPPEYRAYYMLNPVACLLAAYRDCLIAAQPPNTGELGYVAAVALVALAAGFMIFSRGEGTFAKYV